MPKPEAGCVNCGAPNEGTNWHCPHCGQPLQGDTGPSRNGSRLEQLALMLAMALTTLSVVIVVGID